MCFDMKAEFDSDSRTAQRAVPTMPDEVAPLALSSVSAPLVRGGKPFRLLSLGRGDRGQLFPNKSDLFSGGLPRESGAPGQVSVRSPVLGGSQFQLDSAPVSWTEARTDLR